MSDEQHSGTFKAETAGPEWAECPALAQHCEAAGLTCVQADAVRLAPRYDRPYLLAQAMGLPSHTLRNAVAVANRKLKESLRLRDRERTYKAEILQSFRSLQRHLDHGPQQGVKPAAHWGKTVVQEPGEAAEFREYRERGQKGPARRIPIRAQDVQDVPSSSRRVTADDLGTPLRTSPLTFLADLASVSETAPVRA